MSNEKTSKIKDGKTRGIENRETVAWDQGSRLGISGNGAQGTTL